MKVRVYRNLTRNCWSVMSVRTGRVIQHALTLNLKDANFVIQKGGQARVRREGKKYVHAFVTGTLTDEQIKAFVGVTYNPYIHDTFIVRVTNRPVREANVVEFTDNGKVYIG
jgi:hypothetical protein